MESSEAFGFAHGVDKCTLEFFRIVRLKIPGGEFLKILVLLGIKGDQVYFDTEAGKFFKGRRNTVGSTYRIGPVCQKEDDLPFVRIAFYTIFENTKPVQDGKCQRGWPVGAKVGDLLSDRLMRFCSLFWR